MVSVGGGDDSLWSLAGVAQQTVRIVEEDGQKERWVSEPVCAMTSYQGTQAREKKKTKYSAPI